jgi:alcohol dehydrogenase class IV
VEGEHDHALPPPLSYELRLPTLHVGQGAHRRLADEARRLGMSQPLVVSDPNCARIAEVAATVAELGGRLFADVPGEPTTENVAAGVAALRELGADGVVGIGGGAALDTAKSVAVMATNAGGIADYQGIDKIGQPRLPLILAPTTAGTGSEVTRYVAITEPTANVKMLIGDWKLLADVAIVDARLCVSAPPSVTASAGVDALTHAIEAYVSRRRTPTTDIFALGALRQLYPNLRLAFGDGSDLTAREATAIGALHAGIAFGNASVALVHGMSRPIGAYFHVPHGLANSMLLPAVTAWSIEGAPDRYADIAGELGLSAADELPKALTRLAQELRIPRLAEVVDPGELRRLAPRMAEDALASGSPGNNPRVPSVDEIVALYGQCLAI